MPPLPISVIICAKNAESTIKGCLKSVKDNNPVEVVIVDGLSTDRTVEIARKYTGLIYCDEGRGTSYAHQLGAEQATQEYIAYIDADIILLPNTLSTMLRELETSGYVGFFCRMMAGTLSTYWERAAQQHIQILFSRKSVFSLCTILLKRDIVLKYRFDPSISIAGDDNDFCLRLRAAGEKLGISSAFVYHIHRADLKGFIKQKYRNGRAKAQFARKHGLLDPAIWPPLTMVYMLGYCLIKGKPNLIPYFLLDGIIETGGIVKGFIELIGNKLRPKRK